MYLKMVFEPYKAALARLCLPFNKYDLWRKTAKTLKLSKKASLRLEWIIFYDTKAERNASLVCRHFHIHRSQWYYWIKRFNEQNLRTLEELSRSPKNARQKEYTPLQYERIGGLRREFIRYGKLKILKKYQKLYPEDQNISGWKVQCVIQDLGIYYHAQKQARINRKRAKAQAKKRIAELKQKPKTGFLICLDTIVRFLNGKKRFILTAIDRYAKLGFARMYQRHSSFSAQDFLKRLHYLLDGKMENIQTDNGSEFNRYFNQACQRMQIKRYYSRARTPQDNAVCERFNRTLKEEFIALGNMTDDIQLFNKKLFTWLVEYNFKRPHQSLGYMTPVNFVQKYGKVSEMYSSNTTP